MTFKSIWIKRGKLLRWQKKHIEEIKDGVWSEPVKNNPEEEVRWLMDASEDKPR